MAPKMTPFLLKTTAAVLIATRRWQNSKIITIVIIGILLLKTQQISAQSGEVSRKLLHDYNDNENSIYYDEKAEFISNSSDSITTSASNIEMPKEFTCPAEGLYAHNYKCQLYYRCEAQTNGHIKAYLLNCKIGTIFSHDLKMCMPAMLANREECQQYINEIDILTSDDIVAEAVAAGTSSKEQGVYFDDVINSSIDDNDDDSIDSRLMHILNEAKIKGGIAHNGNAMDGTYNHWKNYGLTGLSGVSVISFSTSSARSAGMSSSSSADNDQGPPCEDDGFMSDPDDCTVFYRCISNGRKFNKIGFRCSDGTGWDKSLQSCNHLFKVRGCQGKQDIEKDEYNNHQLSTQSSHSSHQNSTMSSSSLQQNSTSSSSSSSSSSLSSASTSTSSSSITTSQQSSNIENTSVSSSSQQTSTHNENATQSSSVNNDLNFQNSTGSQSNSSQGSSNNSIQEESSSSLNSNSTQPLPMECIDENTYFPNKKDCTKFYRCRKNVKGNLEMVPFTCGPGTIWNQESKECNVPTDSQRETCKIILNGQEQSGSSSQHTESSSQNQSHSVQSSSNQQASSIEQQQLKPQKPLKPNGKCKDSETYLEDKYDCTRFYRCVENSKGGFNTVSFDCAPGTVWDPDLKGCNHPTDIQKEKCKLMANNESSASSSSSSNNQSNESTSNNQGSSSQTGSSSSSSSSQQNSSTTAESHQSSSSAGNQTLETQNSTESASSTGISESSESQTSSGSISQESSTNAGSSSTSTSAVNQSSGMNSTIGSSSSSNAEHSNINQSSQVGSSSINNQSSQSSSSSITQESSQSSSSSTIQESSQSSSSSSTSSSSNSSSSSSTGSSASHESSITHESAANSTQSSSASQSGSSSQQSGDQDSSSIVIQHNPVGICNGNNQYLEDSKDCSKFYRCVKNSKGGYNKIAFTCGPGTVWDSQIEGCNHAWAVKNRNCGSGPSSESQSGTQQETKPSTQLPISSSTSKPSDQKPITSAPSKGPTTLKPTISYPNSTQKPIMEGAVSAKPPTHSICKTEGFIGDPSDCSRFYRCVDNGSAGFTQFSFRCGKGTIWDSELQTCNHDLNKCDQNSASQKPLPVSTSAPSSLKPQTTTTHTPAHQPTTQKPQQTTARPGYQPTTQISNETTIKPGYYPTTQTTEHTTTIKPGYRPTTQTPQETTTKKSDYQTTAQTSKDTTTIKPGYQPTSEYPETTTLTTTSTVKPNPNAPILFTDKCPKEGFFGDSQDCQKFYRCVDNGKGNFEKHSFKCGNNTVWDAEIESCNHPSNIANERCRSETSMTTVKPTSTNKPTSTTTESMPTTTTQPTSTTPIPNLPPGKKCLGEGFMADPDNCRKFYRCIKTSEGYERHEFKCGKNTAWNEESQTCDHRYTVDRCQDQTEEPDLETTTLEYQSTTTEEHSSTTIISTTEILEKPTTEKPSTSRPSTDASTTTSEGSSMSSIIYTTTMQPTSTTPFPNLHPGKKCYGEGFMADPDNCRKFYRCEKSGDTYSKYEFMCAKGTGWNEEKQTCDHRDNIERCQSQTEQLDPETTTIKITTYKPKPFENTTATTEYEKPTTTSTIIYETSTPTTQKPSKQTTTKPISTPDYTSTTQTTSTTPIPNLPAGIKCNGEGFMADPNNCRKFYRCEKNGNSFSKHEFICAKGTGWNEEKQTCDYRSNIARCQGQTEEPEPETTTLEYTSNKPSAGTVAETSTNGYEKPPTTASTTTSYENTTSKNPTTTNSFTTTTMKPPSTEQSITTDFTSSIQTTSTTPIPNLPPGKDCNGEGFMADANDCRKFYRCQKNGNNYSKHEFMCGKGTAWNEEKQTCDYRDNVDRCQGQTEEAEPSTTTIGYEKPTTTTEYEKPVATSTPHVTTTMKSTTDISSTTDYATTTRPNLQPGKICNEEGFMADPDNCSKFYRCEKNENGYSKHEFMCAKGTGWSEEKQACDHRENIDRCQGQTEEPDLENTTLENTTSKPTTSLPLQTTTQPQKPTTTTQATVSVSNPPNQSSSSSTNLPSTTTDYTSTTQPTSTTPVPNLPPGKKCTGEGFMADPDNCRKFYRCIMNGDKFEQHEFACGKGTGWSEDKQTCDHVANIKRCEGQVEETEITTTTIKTTSTPSETPDTIKPTGTEQPTDRPGFMPTTTNSPSTVENVNTTIQTTDKPEQETTTVTNTPTTTETSYTTMNSSDKPGFVPTTSEAQAISTSTESHESTTMEPINHNCTGEGFFPDVDDCNRYYRCVDENHNGKYIVYSFRCPEGTVWDTSVETCNYAEKVSGNCSSGSTTTEYPSTMESTSNQNDKETSTSTTESPEESTTMVVPPPVTEGNPASTTAETSMETTTMKKPEYTTTDNSKDTTTSGKPESTTTDNPKDITTTPQPLESTTSTSPTETTEDSKDKETSIKPETTTLESTTDETSTNTTVHCPPTNEGQNLYICPTGFRRHPKYCNMFYQCTEKADSYDQSIVVFKCPNATVYHEDLNRCDKPKQSEECETKGRTQTALFEEEYKHSHMIHIRSTAPLCPNEGHFPLNNDECTQLFVKCQYSPETRHLEGQIFRCPKGFTYWSVSRRCERTQKLQNCATTQYDVSSSLPVEWSNIGNRRRNLKV